MSKLEEVVKIVEQLQPNFNKVSWRGTPEHPACVLSEHNRKPKQFNRTRHVTAKNVFIHMKEGYLVSRQDPGTLVSSVTFIQGTDRVVSVTY